MDRLGLRKLVGGVAIAMVFYLTATLVPTEASQIAAQLLCTMVLNIFFVLASRFAMLYGPPELFGTFR